MFPYQTTDGSCTVTLLTDTSVISCAASSCCLVSSTVSPSCVTLSSIMPVPASSFLFCSTVPAQPQQPIITANITAVILYEFLILRLSEKWASIDAHFHHPFLVIQFNPDHCISFLGSFQRSLVSLIAFLLKLCYEVVGVLTLYANLIFNT